MRGRSRPADRRLVGILASSALASVALAACGSAPLPPAGGGGTSKAPSSTTGVPSTTTTTPTASSGPPCGVVPAPDAVLTSGTEPCAVTTEVGATVHVSLPIGFTWEDPRSDSGVVEVTGIEKPAGGGLTAELRAVTAGQAKVTSAGSIVCAPGQPCPQLARLWGLRVTVVQRATPPRTVTLTQDDSGTSLTLHSGDGVDVMLSGPAVYVWTEPVSSDAAVLEQVWGSSGVTAGADFLAVVPGTTTVTATGNPACYPKCLAPSRSFRVTVTVTG